MSQWLNAGKIYPKISNCVVSANMYSTHAFLSKELKSGLWLSPSGQNLSGCGWVLGLPIILKEPWETAVPWGLNQSKMNKLEWQSCQIGTTGVKHRVWGHLDHREANRPQGNLRLGPLSHVRVQTVLCQKLSVSSVTLNWPWGITVYMIL